ncbi:glycerophosphodiester phosphodiesterase family protein [Roseibium alexandrii]
MRFTKAASIAALAMLSTPAIADTIELGPRPYYLIDQMAEGPLKEKLEACIGLPLKKTDFSIGHRGAPLQFPEHTVESYKAAALMGAGIMECDVTFTKDKELVCRHAQNDLHTTTDILATDLAGKCTKGFSPADGSTKASAECRTSDLTLAEFKTLNGKMDAADRSATTVEAYMDGTAGWRTDLYATKGTLMTHAESIALFKDLGVKFTPELKSPSVDMPFDGFSQEDYAQKLIDEYKAAGIPALDVFPQSFNLDDVLYWIENEPDFGKQAVYLDGRRDLNPSDPSTFSPSMDELKAKGVNYIAPPLWVLVTLDEGEITASAYARAANEAGLNLVTWTLERSGPLTTGGGWYFQTVKDAIDGDGRVYEVVDVLAQDAGVVGLFSDWPATTTFYASCMDLK